MRRLPALLAGAAFAVAVLRSSLVLVTNWSVGAKTTARFVTVISGGTQ